MHLNALAIYGKQRRSIVNRVIANTAISMILKEVVPLGTSGYNTPFLEASQPNPLVIISVLFTTSPLTLLSVHVCSGGAILSWTTRTSSLFSFIYIYFYHKCRLFVLQVFIVDILQALFLFFVSLFL